eukprot:11011641-Alexandrium_andersonii.AAC.1
MAWAGSVRQGLQLLWYPMGRRSTTAHALRREGTGGGWLGRRPEEGPATAGRGPRQLGKGAHRRRWCCPHSQRSSRVAGPQP